MRAKMRTILTLLVAAHVGASAVLFVACGNSDNPSPNPTPTVHDAGLDSSKKRDGSISTGPDAPASRDGGHDGTTPGQPDVIPLPDVSLDVGPCVSDSGSCNSCYTDAQATVNRYNACSPYTTSCVKFTTTVPTVPPIP
jgi:hypothetical protein